MTEKVINDVEQKLMFGVDIEFSKTEVKRIRFILEKQIPKKPRISKGCNWSFYCSSCNELLYWTDE